MVHQEAKAVSEKENYFGSEFAIHGSIQGLEMTASRARRSETLTVTRLNGQGRMETLFTSALPVAYLAPLAYPHCVIFVFALHII
jgi:hypothetical protein